MRCDWAQWHEPSLVDPGGSLDRGRADSAVAGRQWTVRPFAQLSARATGADARPDGAGLVPQRAASAPVGRPPDAGPGAWGRPRHGDGVRHLRHAGWDWRAVDADGIVDAPWRAAFEGHRHLCGGAIE